MVHVNSAVVLTIAAINAGSTFATPVNANERARDGLASIEVRSTIPAPGAASKWKTAAKTFGPAVLGGVVGPTVAKVLDKISPNKERDTEERARDIDESLVLSRDGLAGIEVRSTIPAPGAANKWKSAAKTFGPAVLGGVVGPTVAKVLDKISPNKERDIDESLVLSRDDFADIEARSTIPAPAAGNMWKTAAKTFGPAVVGGIVGPTVAKVLDKISPNKGRDVEDTIISRAFEDELEARAGAASVLPKLKSAAKTFGPALTGAVVGPMTAKVLSKIDSDKRRDTEEVILARSEVEHMISRAIQRDLAAREYDSFFQRSEDEDIFSRNEYASIEDLD